MKRLFYLIPFFLLLNHSGIFPQNVPVISKRVLDKTGTLKPEQIKYLDTILAKLEKDKGSQVVVLIINSTAPFTIEELSIKIAQNSGVGRKSIDDGLLLLVAKQDRKLRIEVGYGLEALIPDARAKQIISQKIIPQFKRGVFFTGILSGVMEIDRIIRLGQLPPVQKKTQIKKKEFSIFDRIGFFPFALVYSFMQWGFLIQFLVAIVIGYVFSFKSKKKGALISATLIGIRQLFFVFTSGFINLVMFPIYPILSYFVALALHAILRSKGKSSSYSSSGRTSSSSRPSSSWLSSSSSSPSRSSYSSGSSSYSSSSSSSRSSSSSSSSSYSGGGGSFGGGGASGSW